VTASYQRDDFSLRLTARFDDGELDSSHADLNEYSRERLRRPAPLGRLSRQPELGGAFRSQRRNRAADVRCGSASRAGFTYQRLSSGYGNEYPGDRSQNDVIWSP
jgi:hypothetical protein